MRVCKREACDYVGKALINSTILPQETHAAANNTRRQLIYHTVRLSFHE